jgi:hypothetical protein
MGFLDELKDKAEEFGDKATEGFGAAKDKTEEVIENVKDRFDGDDRDADALRGFSRLLKRGSRGHQGGRRRYSGLRQVIFRGRQRGCGRLSGGHC